jgi:hypothetical protein
MSSAPIVFARALSFTPAHLVALSCLYCCWNCSLFATALTLSGILFQLSTTLTLKKFLLISMGPWRILRLRGLRYESLSARPLPFQTTAQGQAPLVCWLVCAPWPCLPGGVAPQGWAFPAQQAFHCTGHFLVLTPFSLPSVAPSPGRTCPPLSRATRLVLRTQGCGLTYCLYNLMKTCLSL